MARAKIPVHRVQLTERKCNIIHQLLGEYDIQSAEGIQDALKELLGSTIKKVIEAERDTHLGYEKSKCFGSNDYHNSYKQKRVNSNYASIEFDVSEDKKSAFTPQSQKTQERYF